MHLTALFCFEPFDGSNGPGPTSAYKMSTTGSRKLFSYPLFELVSCPFTYVMIPVSVSTVCSEVSRSGTSLLIYFGRWS